jgi:hypothetical protein
LRAVPQITDATALVLYGKQVCVMLPDIPAAKVLGDEAAAPARRRGGVAASSIKESDLPPATEDVPASVYSRLERSVILWLIGDNILLTFACVGKKSVRIPCLLMEMMIFQLSLSLNMLYFFGTMDSSAVGRRAASKPPLRHASSGRRVDVSLAQVAVRSSFGSSTCSTRLYFRPLAVSCMDIPFHGQ